MRKAPDENHSQLLKAELNPDGLHMRFDWEIADQITVSNLLMIRSCVKEHNLMISEKQAERVNKGLLEDYHMNLRVLDGIEALLEYFGHQENG